MNPTHVTLVYREIFESVRKKAVTLGIEYENNGARQYKCRTQVPTFTFFSKLRFLSLVELLLAQTKEKFQTTKHWTNQEEFKEK